ncbi:MAG TPA: alpha/beta hydrolase, partial [Myxococcota bacterium]|nr:alpha/beta hydrolase [Myxococcota bacterium]
RTQDIRYGDAERQALDVFTPDEAPEDGARRAVIVFFYGGSWQRGSKESYRFVASQLAERGLVVVLPDYRLHPEVHFPAFVHDAADAVAWALEHASEYGGDPERVFVMGHSAGAHLAALVHYDERFLDQAGADRDPCGFIGLSGPYDFLPLVSPNLKKIFPSGSREESQPVRFVDGGEGPALLIHGMQDDTVKPRNSASLAEAVRQAGGQADLRIYDDLGHVATLLSLWEPLDFVAPTLEDVLGFIERIGCEEPEPGTNRFLRCRCALFPGSTGSEGSEGSEGTMPPPSSS